MPEPLRAHLLLEAGDAEHRQVTAAFLKFTGVDDAIAADGPEAVFADQTALAQVVVDETHRLGLTCRRGRGSEGRSSEPEHRGLRGVLEEARRRGFNVVALDLGLDLSTPQGELVGNVIASVAQWERRIIGQRTKDALAIKKAEGVQIGRRSGVAPAVVSRMQRQRAR